MRPHSQAAKTSPSHGEGVGSIPAGVTKRNKSELFRRSKLVRICFFTVCLARSAPRGALLVVMFCRFRNRCGISGVSPWIAGILSPNGSTRPFWRQCPRRSRKQIQSTIHGFKSKSIPNPDLTSSTSYEMRLCIFSIPIIKH